jgi:hypothetical protein
LTFEYPPASDAPFWKQILNSRTIEQPDVGRLSWRPVLTWKCSRPDAFLESFVAWFREEDPIFPPPLIRIEFSSRVAAGDAAKVLESLFEYLLPCRFKMFSLSARASSHFDPEHWADLIRRFHTTTDRSPNEPKVIDLFPERASV